FCSPPHALSPGLPFSFFVHSPSPPPQIYTLSLHDALPIYLVERRHQLAVRAARRAGQHQRERRDRDAPVRDRDAQLAGDLVHRRSEEHTSELQSHLNLVCRLLLEKKKQKIHNRSTTPTAQI